MSELHTVKTIRKEKVFVSRQAAEDYFYNSTDKHKIALLMDAWGKVVIVQTDYGCFQNIT